jgi:hypothetical protein
MAAEQRPDKSSQEKQQTQDEEIHQLHAKCTVSESTKCTQDQCGCEPIAARNILAAVVSE